MYVVFPHLWDLSVKDLRERLCTIWEVNRFRLGIEDHSKKTSLTGNMLTFNSLLSRSRIRFDVRSQTLLFWKEGDGGALHTEKQTAGFPHLTCIFLKNSFSVSVFHLDIVYLPMVCQSPITTKIALKSTERYFDTTCKKPMRSWAALSTFSSHFDWKLFTYYFRLKRKRLFSS